MTVRIETINDDRRQPMQSVLNGLRCRCPRCGEGHVFSRFLTVADSCEACGLDFGFADPADGPAFFVMTGVGILVTAIWAVWAVMAQPPIWMRSRACRQRPPER